jgi:hypothetical protein
MNAQNQPNSAETFEGFAIVELMGRNVIAGYCTQELVAGVAMLRVDVPAVEERPGFTKFFSGGSIYAVTPCDEEAATIAAKNLRTRPIEVWVVPERKALPAPTEGEYDDPNHYDEDDEDEIVF